MDEVKRGGVWKQLRVIKYWKGINFWNYFFHSTFRSIEFDFVVGNISPGKINLLYIAWNSITDASSFARLNVLFSCTTRSSHPPCKRTTQGKWEIYLLIVISRIVKSTYPVMFVMIFDSISIEGILKKCIKSLHSCWNEMERSRCRRNDENLMLDAPRTPLSLPSLFVNLYFMRVFIRSCEIATFQWFPVFIFYLFLFRSIFSVFAPLFSAVCLFRLFSYLLALQSKFRSEFIEFPYDLVQHACAMWFYYFVHDYSESRLSVVASRRTVTIHRCVCVYDTEAHVCWRKICLSASKSRKKGNI